MKFGWKLLVVFLMILSITTQLFSQDRYEYIYPFTMFQTYYGIEHQNDAYSSMKNPALAGLMEHDGKAAFSISYNDWFIYSPLSIAAIMPISEDMELGLSFNYIDVPVMYGCIIGYGEQQYFNLSSAITYHKVLDVSLGFSAKLFHDEYDLAPELSDVINYYDFDAGALIQLPLMKASEKEKINLLGREMRLDITPGAQVVWINIKQDVSPKLSGFLRSSLYDQKLKRDVVEFVYSFGNQKGFKAGIMNVLNFYISNLGSSNYLKNYAAELNCSQLIRDVYAVVSKKELSKGLLAKSDFLISYGTFDLTSLYMPNNYNIRLQYNF